MSLPLKARLGRRIHALSYAGGISTRMTRRQGGMRILMYHNIDGAELSAKPFRAGLSYLRRNFSVIPLGELVRKQEQGKSVAGNEVALTFDDGYRNLATVVAPILQEYKMPATFFVCPGLIENRQWIWTQDLRERLAIISPVQLDQFAAEQGWPDWDVERLILRMRKMPQQERLAQCERIRERTKHFAPSRNSRNEFDLMTWEELSGLDPKWITIGSHSATHPILSSMPLGEMAQEIAGSREMLERRLGRPVESFCYPNGEYNEAVTEIVRRNYTAAVTTEWRAVGLKDDAHLLPRISAAGTPSLLAWRMFRPSA